MNTTDLFGIIFAFYAAGCLIFVMGEIIIHDEWILKDMDGIADVIIWPFTFCITLIRRIISKIKEQL